MIKVELLDSMGTDRSICETAWTSSIDQIFKNKKIDKDVEILIKHLAANKHGTPFESVVYKFWIRMPIFTDRQFMTHRIASHNGLSGRYRTVPTEYYQIPEDIKILLTKVENDCSTNLVENLDYTLSTSVSVYQEIIEQSKKSRDIGTITSEEYKRIREITRGVMPQAAMTERVSVFNLRSLANFFKLRLSPHAQPEIQKVAALMLNEVERKNNCPIAIKELEKNGWII